MLNRYGEKGKAEERAELAADGDLAGVAVWLRIIDAIGQLAIGGWGSSSGAVRKEGTACNAYFARVALPSGYLMQ
jgi:hypothetical protein